ncbi:Na(+)-translocating NADH-quinone reductase subunit C [Candidatus Ornithobacterium hominis]|uniref:Na(+)-translocating NADH-quinone reductase subunit C n=1 Tax=Candidatus Ornithobacterium hominis TaxID=2497989 RepID=A0A383TYS7_9FLAO|nr:Na(+)-translocating NADH-quinone reductase subunit C [Candidatus Ornithobacterium hominis]MCT7904113.1 Na(+)-translocating NADH-quinone reductase subunit C [Candidatus Ornithobacterium hominis]SZD72349.1 Na(+)-translocating NADH-quinone reductase subunit C [Candidatus Ornithobacterium hominis]
MAKNTDSNVYTVVFAVIMVVVVGAILAFVASSLNGKIKENERLETQQNILYAMGENQDEEPYTGTGSVNFIPAEKAETEFKKYIKKQYVLQGDEMREDPEAFTIDIKKEEELAKKTDYQRRLPLFIGERDNQEFYIIPMRGKGLWDAIWGYLALNNDLEVQGVYFDHASETPGLGANIKERYFMDDFHGEKILDENNNLEGITVAKGNMDPLNERKDDFKVDAISGATITGDGVTAMINNTLDMYLPYLLKLSKK